MERDGDANGTDYIVTATGGTLSANKLQLTLADGVTSATVTATPVDDTTVEGTETVILTLSAGTGYVVGTPSSASGSITDNDAPPPPTINALPANTTSPVTISGTGVAGATITLYEGPTVIGTATVGAGGTWTTTVSSLTSSSTGVQHTITAQQTVGILTSLSSGSVTTRVYVVPGAPAISNATVGSVKKGVATVTVTGTGVAGYTITLYNGATVLGTVVASNGTWSISVSLATGSHTLSATQTQVAGVVSPHSASRSSRCRAAPPLPFF